MSAAVLVVVVTGPTAYLSANGREGWRARARLAKQWREASAWHHLAAMRSLPGPWPWPGARLDVLVHHPNRRVQDATNRGAPSAKPAVDGAVTDAGLLPGDDDHHLLATTYRAVLDPR